MAKTICVIGLGYIGLPTATMFAGNAGYRVIGVDINPTIIKQLHQGKIHIQEPGLEEIFYQAWKAGKIIISETVQPADVFIIAVPTPILPDKAADLSYVVDATRSIVTVIKKGNLVVLESTVPPATINKIISPIFREAGIDPSKDILVAHCPERVLPGHILDELIHNDRVIGGFTPAAAEAAKQYYSSFVKGGIFLTDATTAEMVKIMENTFRDVNIALANEFALMGEELGIDIWQAIDIANHHPRVKILRPGPGVGGHCIAVDPWFLVQTLPLIAQLVRKAREINDLMPHHVVEKVDRILEEIQNPKIAILGLTFKGDVDDIRESPAIKIIEYLKDKGYQLNYYDPFVKQSQFPGIHKNVEAGVTGADLILVLTDHSSFKLLDASNLLQRMRTRIVFDTRHILNSVHWLEAGCTFYALGTPDSLYVKQLGD